MNISLRTTSLVFLILLFITPSLFSQEAAHVCGFDDEAAHELTDFQDTNGKYYWQNTIAPALSQSKVQSDVDAIHIPVVVHVVHQGEPYGVGRNIPFKQVESQIDELNKSMMGWDNNENIIPERWLDLVDYPKLKFFLADTDPDGLPTNGVTRDSMAVVNPQTGNMITSAVKAALNWDPNLYMNIYVLAIQGTSESGGLVGFSSFPSSVGTEGDGFVVDYRWFGGPGFPQVGYKTTVHEAGHYLGLYHTFAGNSCNLDDGLADTPNAGENTNAVSTFTCDDGYPVGPTTCTEEHLYPNHMDYAHRSCRTMFTEDQAAVMRSVMDGTSATYDWPSRQALADNFETAVHLQNDDAGLCRLVYPQEIYCGQSTVSPIVEIKNYGTENLNHLWIKTTNDQGWIDSTEWIGDLCLAQKTMVQLNQIEVLSGTTEWTFEVSYFDNTIDENLSNNTLVASTYRPEALELPVLENFEIPSSDGLFGNQLNMPATSGQNWELNNLASANGQGTQSIYFQNKMSASTIVADTLFSDNLNFDTESSVHLCFKTAYRSDSDFGDLWGDSLAVLISTGCEEFVYEEIWKTGGQALASDILNNSNPFIPNPNEWQQWSIDLSAYIGTQNIRIAFVNYSSQLETLYLDDIKIKPSDNCATELDASIAEVISPSPFGCRNEFTDVFVKLKNEGTLELTEVQFELFVNNSLIGQQTWSGVLAANASTTVYLPSFPTPIGDYELKIVASAPNQDIDENLSNNLVILDIFDTTSQPALLQEDFEMLQNQALTPLEPSIFGGWLSNSFVSAYGVGGRSISVQANSDAHWLLSANFDYSMIENATLTFDYAYAYSDNGNGIDSLFVLASTDCGASYEHVLFQKSGAQLSTYSNPNNTPSPAQWQTGLLDLSAFDNETNLRFAFVFKANTGNTFYLDNVNLNTNCAMNVQPIITNATCADSCNGAMDFEVSGNIGNITYDYSNLPNSNPTNLCAGNYQVTIIDEANCAWIEEISISAAEALTLDILPIGYNCENQETIFELLPAGGDGNYSYDWADFNETPTQLADGTYLVTISDGLACSLATSITITPILPLSINATVNPITGHDSQDGSIILDVQGGFGDYEYEWNLGTGGAIQTGLDQGTYAVTITDSNGCFIAESFQLLGFDCSYFQPTLDIQNVLCFGDNTGSLSIINNGGIEPLTYEWIDLPNQVTIENLSANNYSGTIIDANNCPVSFNSELTQPPALSIEINATSESAFGQNDGSAIAIVTGGTPANDGTYQYSWSNLGIENEINNLTPDTYELTVTDNNGCQATASVLITSFECQLDVNVALQNATCNEDSNGQITIDESAFTQPLQINWSIPGDGLVQSDLAVGNYTVTVVDGSNCTWQAGFNIGVSDMEPPLIVATDITLSLDINGTAIINPDLVAIGSFDNCQLNSLTTSITNFDCSHLGINMVTLTGEDGNGNSASADLTVTVIDELVPNLTCPDAVLIENCNGLIAYDLPTAQDNCELASVELISGPNNGDLVATGTYQVTYQATDASENSSTCTFEITVTQDELVLDTTLTPESCQGAMDGAVIINSIAGAQAPYDFISESTGLEAGITYVTITGSDGCSVDWPIDIPQIPAIALEILLITPTTNGADNGSISTNTTGGTTPYLYEWFLDGEIITFDANPVAIASGIYTCQITDANDCVFLSDTIIVENINSTKDADFSNLFNIYPNPADNYLIIELENEPIKLNKLRLFNALGQQIKLNGQQLNGLSTLQLDLQDLSKGAYFLELKHQGQVLFYQFVKL